MTIEYIGLREFTAIEIKDIETLTGNAYKKLQRESKEGKFIVHVKKYEKAGER